MRNGFVARIDVAADNAMIQMSGAATGLLVTEVFHDEIEFFADVSKRTSGIHPFPARNQSPDATFGLRSPNDSPQRATSIYHSTRKPSARRPSVRAFGVTSIAVVFLHSFLNPAHERRAREIILNDTRPWN